MEIKRKKSKGSNFFLFQPLGLVALIVVAGSLASVIYYKMMINRGAADLAVAPGATGQTVAAVRLSRINIGQDIPHAFLGNECLKCHFVRGNPKPPIPAPIIAADAVMPHPFRGECKICHKMVGGGANPVAFINMLAVGNGPFGAEMLSVNPEIAMRYKLNQKSGVLVNAITPGSYAEQAGLEEGDIIVQADNKTIDTLDDLTHFLATKGPGDSVKFKVIKMGQGTKKIRITVDKSSLAQSGVNNQIGILGVTGDLNGSVAYSLENAPFLIIYNLKDDTFRSVPNETRGAMPVDSSDWIVRQKVSAIIVGNVGGADLSNLKNANVKVYTGVFGQAKDAVVLFKQGQLVENSGVTADNVAQVGFNQLNINTVAVPANFPDPTANVCANLSDARYLLVVQLDQNKLSVFNNPIYGQAAASGVRTVQFLVDQQVDAIISTDPQPVTLEEMKRLQVHFVRASNMSAGDAVMNFKNGNLQVIF